MEFPNDLKYTKEHEWTRADNGIAVIGITDFAQDELGDVVFVELPDAGKQLKGNETLGVVESVKTVSDIYSPVSGEVVEVNSALENEPELVNKSPYTDGWMVKIKMSDPADMDKLLSSEDYERFVKESK